MSRGICLYGVVRDGQVQAMCTLPDDHDGAHRLMDRAGQYVEPPAPRCGASWDEGRNSFDCELPAGHDGEHRATIEWQQVPMPPAPFVSSPGYVVYLMSRFADTPSVATSDRSD